MQFAQRYRVLGQAIESGADATSRKRASARSRPQAHLAELEATLERLRLELTEADSQATSAREAAHASEMEIGRLQQQIAFDRQQIEQLTATAADIDAEVRALDARQEPARQELEARRDAAQRAEHRARRRRGDACRRRGGVRRRAAANRGPRRRRRGRAQRSLCRGQFRDRALRHAMEHAIAARARMAEQIAALEIEDLDLGIEAERAAGERMTATDALERARSAMDVLRIDRAARESELLGARSIATATPPSSGLASTTSPRSSHA